MPDTVDWGYVQTLLTELQGETEGFHLRVNEIENLRYLEDKVALASEEKPSGVEVRIGQAADLIENVKASIVANPPQVKVEPLRDGDQAFTNSSKRELFWNQFLLWINGTVPLLSELVDAQAGLGMGVLKGASFAWPKEPRKRKDNETAKDHQSRVRGLKRHWGPPLMAVTIHPLAFYRRMGAGNQIAEAIEHSWKPKRQVMKDYQGSAEATNISIDQLAASMGQPSEAIRPLPYGSTTTTMSLVTEYWSPELYQVYINGQMVHEEAGNVGVKYFLAMGRTNSSKDPDKAGFSVAEHYRHNEPIINRTLTRMAEAAELLVRKRLTLILPEGSIEGVVEDETGSTVPKTWTLKGDSMEALPAGSEPRDPFAGVENVYAAMPFINLLLQLTGEHGVAPIFKGMPPGAAGSGYRDVSLYMMAQSQFSYLVQSYSSCLSQFVTWCEDQLLKGGKEVFVGNASLRPSDIEDWPAIITVDVQPQMPQNLIPMGQFYDRMHARGHITRRTVLEEGLRMEQPEQEMRQRFIEDIQDQYLKPKLAMDVLQILGILPEMPVEGTEAPVTTLTKRGPGGAQQLLSEANRGQGEAGQAQGGLSRAGQPRQPPEEPGSVPTGFEEE